MVLTIVYAAWAMAAAAQAPAAQAPAIPLNSLAIGPKQDDPRALCASATGAKFARGSRGIIIQGGLRPDPENDPKASGGAVAIGPKQDDPRASQAGMLAIGPKQDDPRVPALAGRPGDDNDPKARQAARCAPTAN